MVKTTNPQSKMLQESEIECLKQKEQLTRKEAALYIGETVPMLYYYIGRYKDLQTARIKVKGRIYFNREIIDQWLKRKMKA